MEKLRSLKIFKRLISIVDFSFKLLRKVKKICQQNPIEKWALLRMLWVINAKEVYERLSKIRGKNAPGSNGAYPRVFKETGDIFSACILTKIAEVCWKITYLRQGIEMM